VIAPFQAALSLLAALALAGCANAPGPARAPASACARGQQPMAAELLYFGTRTPDGVVTSAEWGAFVDTEVTPRFPDGLTAWRASGQWRSAAGALVREDTWVLHIVDAPDAAPDAEILGLVEASKKRFAQQSVLRVSGVACVAFRDGGA